MQVWNELQLLLSHLHLQTILTVDTATFEDICKEIDGIVAVDILANDFIQQLRAFVGDDKNDNVPRCFTEVMFLSAVCKCNRIFCGFTPVARSTIDFYCDQCWDVLKEHPYCDKCKKLLYERRLFVTVTQITKSKFSQFCNVPGVGNRCLILCRVCFEEGGW